MLHFEIRINEKCVLHKKPSCGFHKYGNGITGFEIDFILSSAENEGSYHKICREMKAGGQIKNEKKHPVYR